MRRGTPARAGYNRLIMRLASGVLLLGFAVIAPARPDDSSQPARHAVRGIRGSVAAGSDLAVDAGMQLFHAGGNAVDAGVATLFAASVAEFSHFGFGGEAPILIRARDGKVVCIAGVGAMPRLATAEFFRRRPLRPGEVFTVEPHGLSGVVPVAGVMPALVPGMVEGGLVALREYGTKSFSEVIAPALFLAGGMPLEEDDRSAIAMSHQFFRLWPESLHTFFPDGRLPRLGDLFRQPGLAHTLRLMAGAEQRALAAGASRTAAIDAVHDAFYKGETARKIDQFSRAHDGLLRFEDMAAFHLEPEDPVSTSYRGYIIYKPGFWSQGPVMIQMLNILEGMGIGSLGFNSAAYIHTVTEAMKLAFADRDTYYGDPAFVRIAAARLLSKEYAAERRKEITDKASQDFRPGVMDGAPGRHPSESGGARVRITDALMAGDTTCIDAVDSSGMMFSATPSGASLPAVIAGDTGVALSHRAQSFYLIPGHPNELAGGKRPRVTLSPTLVLRDGRPIAALSTPGGDNQDQALLQIFLDVVEFGMNAQQAVEAPRFESRHLVSSFDNHAMNPGELILDERIPASVFTALEERGHKLERNSRWNGGAAPVMIRLLLSGTIEAAADPYSYRNAQAW